MTISNIPTQKSAKTQALENFVAKFKQEASKEVISEQQIYRAIAATIPLWLESLDDPALTQFFVGIEMAAGAADAHKIEGHPLRPAAVAPLVEAARKEAEVQKQARKAEAQRTKEEREKEKLAELLAKYGPAATDKTEEVAD